MNVFKNKKKTLEKLQTLKKRKKRALNKKRKKRFFTSMRHTTPAVIPTKLFALPPYSRVLQTHPRIPAALWLVLIPYSREIRWKYPL